MFSYSKLRISRFLFKIAKREIKNLKNCNEGINCHRPYGSLGSYYRRVGQSNKGPIFRKPNDPLCTEAFRTIIHNIESAFAY